MGRIYGIFQGTDARITEERLFQPWKASRIQSVIDKSYFTPLKKKSMYVIIKLSMWSIGSWLPAFEIQNLFIL